VQPGLAHCAEKQRVQLFDSSVEVDLLNLGERKQQENAGYL